MRILLINHYAGTEKHGMEFRPFRLAKEWVKLGHDITVVAGSFSHLRNVNPTSTGPVFEEIIEGIRYRWIKTRAYSANGVSRIGSIFDFVYGLYSEKNTFLAKWRPDVVIASSTYPFDMYPARSIAYQFGAKLVWEVHDLWPLSPIELGGYSKWHPFIIGTQIAENFSCRNADLTVSILPHADRHLIKKGLSPNRYLHIPNGVEPQTDVQPNLNDPLAKDCLASMRNRFSFLIVYSGSHTDSYDLKSLLDAANQLGSQIGVIMLGDGPAKNSLVEAAKGFQNANIAFLPRLPRSEALALVSACDAAFVGLKAHSLFRFGIGMNKIYDSMLCGIPIIASYAASNDPVGEADCGYRVDPECPTALANAIRRLSQLTTEERLAMGNRGRIFVKAHHSYDQLAKRFLEAIDAVRAD